MPFSTRRFIFKSNSRRQRPESDEAGEGERQCGMFCIVNKSPTDPQVVDVVALHGLNGHYQRTWTAKTSDGTKVNWLKDLLPAQIPNARVLSFGYDSAVQFSKSVSGISDFAEQLLNELLAQRETVEEKQRPLIFVCHSLGGLVFKQALIRAHERGRYSDLLAYIHGVAFFGTPHRGSAVASWGNIFANIAKTASLGTSTNAMLTRDLKERSGVLSQISTSFVERGGKLDIFSFYETDKFPGMSCRIVEKDSAVLGWTNETTIPISGDHTSICRFSSVTEAERGRWQVVQSNLGSMARTALNKSIITEAAIGNTETSILATVGQDAPSQMPSTSAPDTRRFPVVTTLRSKEHLAKAIEEASKMERLLPDGFEEAHAVAPYGSGAPANNTSNSIQHNNSGSGHQNSGSGQQNIGTNTGSGQQYIGTNNIVTHSPDHKGDFSTASPPVCNFVNRPALYSLMREQLHDTLSEQQVHSKILVVFGLGGAGKSQLTLKYAETHRDDYTGVFWIEAGQKESIEKGYRQLYSQLFENKESTDLAADIAIARVKSWFDGRDGRWLFVLDSADTIDHDNEDSYIDLRNYIPTASSVDVIITTRSSEARAITKLRPVEVAELEIAEAVELLRNSNLMHAPEQVLVDIVKELGYLALAISLAGAYISATPRLKNNIHGYLPEYHERRKILLSRKPTKLIDQYGESVLTTWESSFTAICKVSPAASQLLGLLAYLDPDDIPELFFQMDEKQDWQSEIFPGGALDKYKFEDVFRTLRTYSLVHYQDAKEAYYLHRLVHAWAYDRLEEKERDAFCITSLNLLATISSGSTSTPEFRIRVVPHIMMSYRLSIRVYEASSNRRGNIIDYFGELGGFLRAEGHWAAELQFRKFCCRENDQLLGQEHPDTLTSMAALASTYQNQGRWKEAEELFVQVTETRKRVLGQEHPDTLTTNLASTFWNQGRWKEAEELEVQVMETRTRVLGQEHPDTLISMNNLAWTWEGQGRDEEALHLMLSCLELSARKFGVDHPYTIARSRTYNTWKGR
ncbi:hypothetical protein BP5796_08811 [Coleophoma crateriformis]|uniref:NB-ARC domain-containing protein n=1 Tax=Coleophoma crateriformis TaxID=565419 RepID=A0A3D8R976_9HELO|nr:hypothetical protein BP5796_08811 [Coleophoma crateriformis]